MRTAIHPAGSPRGLIVLTHRTDSSPRSTHLRRTPALSNFTILAITTAIQALVSLAAFSVPVFAPEAATELGFSVGVIGYFVSIMYVGASTSALISGGFILRFGAIRVSQVGLVFCAMAMALLCVLPLPLMPLAGLLLGAGYGPITPASSHVLVRTTPPHLMALTFSIKQSGVPLGTALAGLMVPALTLGFGWRSASLAVALLCIITAVIAQPLRAALDADRDPARPISLGHLREPFSLIFANPELVRMVLSGLTYAGIQICCFTFLVAYLTQSLAYTLVAAGLALSFANGAGIFGRIVWGWLADRTRAPRVVLGVLGITMMLASLGIAAFTASTSYALVLAVCTVFGLSAVGWNGVQISETARLSPPGKAALVAGGSTFMIFGGVLVFSALFALLHDVTDSWRAPFVLFCLPAGVMGVVQLVYARR